MKKMIAPSLIVYAVMAVCVFSVISPFNAEATIYVDGSVGSSGTGTSWGTAKKTIPEAITAASVGEDIWIKQGTYLLLSQIEVNKVVGLYGGFNGTETQKEQRNFRNNITTVDGNNSTRCFYVTANATIDGFVITKGKSQQVCEIGPLGCDPYCIPCTPCWGPDEPPGCDPACNPWCIPCQDCLCDGDGFGGGMYISASPTIKNCTLSYNQATTNSRTVCGYSFFDPTFIGGAAIYGGAPVITNCSFLNNTTDGFGGGFSSGMYNNSNIPFSNCLFEGNSGFLGGGLYAVNFNATNCTFSKNNMAFLFGGPYVGSAALSNCIIWGNTSDSILGPSGTPPSIIYSDINTTGYGNPDGSADSNGNIRKDPLFVNPATGDFRLQETSPCIDAGTSTNAPATDLDGKSRCDDSDVANTGGGTLPYYDMGAYEYECETTLVQLSAFTPIPKAGEIILTWTTESEIDNAGFNLYRAELESGEYEKINTSLIPAKGFATQGTSYEFIDSGVQNRKIYYYKLEDVDLNGNSTIHGPVSAMPRLIYGLGK